MSVCGPLDLMKDLSLVREEKNFSPNWVKRVCVCVCVCVSDIGHVHYLGPFRPRSSIVALMSSAGLLLYCTSERAWPKWHHISFLKHTTFDHSPGPL